MTKRLSILTIFCAAGAFIAPNLTSADAAVVTETVRFEHTGGTQDFVVPDGVTEVAIVACGGAGGTGGGDGTVAGGVGARVTTTLAVTPGESLAVNVGGRAGDGDYADADLVLAGGPGGFNGGGAGGFADGSGDLASGGGGGGASDVRQDGTGLGDRVVVGAGGGGGGAVESADDGPIVPGTGGAGGVTGADGGNDHGGEGGQVTAGGLGGAGDYLDGGGGASGEGGEGGGGEAINSRGGGGGGGGLFGGGGGGSGDLSAAGGGGGGSSLGGFAANDCGAGDGYVEVRYGVTTTPPPVGPPGAPGGPVSAGPPFTG